MLGLQPVADTCPFLLPTAPSSAETSKQAVDPLVEIQSTLKLFFHFSQALKEEQDTLLWSFQIF
jgi:hypothetical protein